MPIKTPRGLFSIDEHPRRTTTAEKLAALKPLHPEIEGFSITAGNACGANDAAALLAIASSELGLPALATVRSWANVGVEPSQTGLSPVTAIESACTRRSVARRCRPVRDQRGLRRQLCCLREASGDRTGKVNVSGSGCSLGHPVAATGARMLVTLVHELRRRGGESGLQRCVRGQDGIGDRDRGRRVTVCGGGMGSATVIEVAG